MKFNLSKPCKHCPFRNDITPFISPERAASICDAVLKGNKTFQCHETPSKNGGSHCAGALILTEKMKAANSLQQIAERLGLYDSKKLKLDAPIYESHNEMVEAHNKRKRDLK